MKALAAGLFEGAEQLLVYGGEAGQRRSDGRVIAWHEIGAVPWS